MSPYLTPNGSDPTSKNTSVTHSPPSAKKALIHATMSVPANLKDAQNRWNIESIDEVSQSIYIIQGVQGQTDIK